MVQRSGGGLCPGREILRSRGGAGAGHHAQLRPWLTAELTAVGPEIVVALGATAAQALFGPAFRVTRRRGERIDWPPTAGPYVGSKCPVTAALAAIHPSAVLRARNADDRKSAFAGLVADLRVAAGAIR